MLSVVCCVFVFWQRCVVDTVLALGSVFVWFDVEVCTELVSGAVVMTVQHVGLFEVLQVDVVKAVWGVRWDG